MTQTRNPSWLKQEIDRAGGITTLARHLGTSRQAVEHWTVGRNFPDDGHTTQLAALLGLPEAVLRQRLRMPTFGDVEAAEIFKAGVEHGFGMVVRAIDEAMTVLDADSGEVRRSS